MYSYSESSKSFGAARNSRVHDPGGSPGRRQAQFGKLPGRPRNLAWYPGLQVLRGTDWDVTPCAAHEPRAPPWPGHEQTRCPLPAVLCLHPHLYSVLRVFFADRQGLEQLSMSALAGAPREIVLEAWLLPCQEAAHAAAHAAARALADVHTWQSSFSA